jgi:hypothetical protein
MNSKDPGIVIDVFFVEFHELLRKLEAKDFKWVKRFQ